MILDSYFSPSNHLTALDSYASQPYCTISRDPRSTDFGIAALVRDITCVNEDIASRELYSAIMGI